MTETFSRLRLVDESGVFARFLASDNIVSQTMRGQSPHGYLVLSEPYGHALYRSIRALAREYARVECGASFAVWGCVLLLLAQLSEIESYSFYGIDRTMMEIVSYIREHCDTVSVAFLAQRYGYSEAYFSRLVRNRCGMGARQMIISARLDRAQELLRNTDLPVRDIASMVGYTSYSHFNRMFRKAHHMSPAAYRSFMSISAGTARLHNASAEVGADDDEAG